MTVVVRVVAAADGGWTPHNGRYVLRWDPHVKFGTLACDSTDDLAKAKRWASLVEALTEWKTVSRVQPRRPTDGLPSKPLTAITVVCEPVTP